MTSLDEVRWRFAVARACRELYAVAKSNPDLSKLIRGRLAGAERQYADACDEAGLLVDKDLPLATAHAWELVIAIAEIFEAGPDLKSWINQKHLQACDALADSKRLGGR